MKPLKKHSPDGGGHEAGHHDAGRHNASRHEENRNERLQAMVDSALDGLVTINGSGLIESFNPACERIFGYGAMEVIGRNMKLLMPGPYGREKRNTDGKTGIVGAIGCETTGRRKDGTAFPLELSVSSFELDDGEHYCGIIRDIGARKKAELETKRHLAALKRSNQELDDFAHIASHDLKEPLCGLSNNAIFLKEDCAGKLDEKSLRRLDRMTFLCERMERLVNDLLYFSRLGRQELAVQEADLNKVVSDIEFLMDCVMHDCNATITIDNELPAVTCDLPRMTEVFRNLIANAVKYNDKPDKRVNIGCIQQDVERVFYVRDNGIGIPEQFHQEIFRIFKRLNEEDDDKRGTGVGLTFVKKIIERHDGSIWVESKPGQGATFYFTINTPWELES